MHHLCLHFYALNRKIRNVWSNKHTEYRQTLWTHTKLSLGPSRCGCCCWLSIDGWIQVHIATSRCCCSYALESIHLGLTESSLNDCEQTNQAKYIQISGFVIKSVCVCARLCVFETQRAVQYHHYTQSDVLITTPTHQHPPTNTNTRDDVNVQCWTAPCRDCVYIFAHKWPKYTI